VDAQRSTRFLHVLIPYGTATVLLLLPTPRVQLLLRTPSRTGLRPLPWLCSGCDMDRPHFHSCLCSPGHAPLLRFEQAQIAFRPIVIEGDGEVVEEAESLVLMCPQPVEEVAYWTLPAPATSWRAVGWRQGILREPSRGGSYRMKILVRGPK